MKKHAVIVAGGSGSRMGGGMPKQFRSLCGRPVLWWSIKAFHCADPSTEIILVLPKDFISLWQDFYSSLPNEERFPHRITSGGASRGESVRNGLSLIEDEDGKDSLIAVHDGARPLISQDLISKGWEMAEIHDGAIPVIGVTDSLRKLTSEGSRSVDRTEFLAVQTPQVFKTGKLKKAYDEAGDFQFTDDAAVFENAGHSIRLFDGEPINIKITNPKDMVVAAALMGKNG